MNWMKTFGSLIQKARLQKDLSLRDLSELAGLDYSYISRIEKGYNPSKESVIKLSKALHLPEKKLLSIAGYSPKIDLLNALEDEYAEINAAGQMLTPKQRLAIIRAIHNPEENNAKQKIPILGTIKADIPLLSEQNITGYIDIPADLERKVDFALFVTGDSMIGAGIYDSDVVLCKQHEIGNNGQIVVALLNKSNTILKYFIQENGKKILRAANPAYMDIDLCPTDKIQGYVVKILKDPPPINKYGEFIYLKERHLQEWNNVIEKSISSGIKPSLIHEFVEAQIALAKRFAGK
jgi:repressor LexA